MRKMNVKTGPLLAEERSPARACDQGALVGLRPPGKPVDVWELCTVRGVHGL